MKSKIHRDKVLDQYIDESNHYDAFHENSENARITNTSVEKILKKYKIKTVLDMTCGTGSQVFWLVEHGYEVTGSEQKAKQKKLNIDLIHGDMRSLRAGEFDAVITIFNAVGHLTKSGFEKAMRNIHKNLSDGGIYIFDIINLNFLAQVENIIKLSYERIVKSGKSHFRELQHSKDMLNRNGFKVLGQYEIDGSKFSDKNSERILMVARKI